MLLFDLLRFLWRWTIARVVDPVINRVLPLRCCECGQPEADHRPLVRFAECDGNDGFVCHFCAHRVGYGAYFHRALQEQLHAAKR